MHAPPLTRLVRPVVLRETTDEHRASTWLELFFDLCFVIAMAAIAITLHEDPTVDGAIRAMAALVLSGGPGWASLVARRPSTTTTSSTGWRS